MSPDNPARRRSTRRTILHRGGIVAGALLGGVAATGSTQAQQQGGTGFIPRGEFQDDEFTVVEPSGTADISPTCVGNAPPQEYQGYTIEYAGGGRATLYVNRNRNVETGTDQEFVIVENCGDYCRVVFKPVTGPT